MLRSMRLEDVGPASKMDLSLGPRINVLTGDNGLGKSFVLDVAWWILTGTWAGRPAWPRRGRSAKPRIRATVESAEGPYDVAADFNYRREAWDGWQAKTTPPLTLYARVDGSFSAADPARDDPALYSAPSVGPMAKLRPVYHFTPKTLWDGLNLAERPSSNGLIRDWVSWQQREAAGEESPFPLLRKAVETLSPHPDDEWMRPGKAVRVSIDDPREIPTVELPYETIPIIHASAGMQRVLNLAYLIVWAWHDHVQVSKLLHQEPTRHIVLLLDEVETHLHPQWQRRIVRALLKVLEGLGSKMNVQVLLTTHSPLILASLEPYFDRAEDKLLLFELVNKRVRLREWPWAKEGDADSWLTSEVFGLKQARSIEAERAIKAAEAFMRDDRKQLPRGLTTKAAIHKELVRVLPDLDPFWPRWIVHHERKSR